MDRGKLLQLILMSDDDIIIRFLYACRSLANCEEDISI
jgi:hypothetical protein